ncbi:4 [Hexamita inflata]|uniref:4 n=1 Tax=Hexamita inflata TaxID=28002 RepID=A0AA86RHJ7_9EUKA|nr:4 [Hexamita inflata] [Hexamita inflata]
MLVTKEDLFTHSNQKDFEKYRQYILTQRQEYTQLDFQIITYNLASQKPEQIFQNILRFGKKLYIIALQEVNMNTVTILSSKCKETEQYQQFLQESLPDYEIQYCQLGPLVLFTASQIPNEIMNIQFFPVATGGGGMKNKGGINCFVTYENTRYLFMGCHLAASRGPDGPGKRNANIQKIFSNKQPVDRAYCDELQECTVQTEGVAQFYDNQKVAQFSCPNNEWNPILKQCDYCFIFGDMNYRIQNKNTINIIHTVQPDQLLVFDELTWQLKGVEKYQQQCVDDSEADEDQDQVDDIPVIQQSRILREFKEEPIKFLPTYRMKGSVYDAERIPSYTDRVIFKQISQDIKLKVIEYTSPGQVFSDHLPVSFSGQISVRPQVIDYKTGDQEYAAVYKVLKPQVQLLNSKLELPLVKYGHVYDLVIQIQNQHQFSTALLNIENSPKFIINPLNVKAKANCTTDLVLRLQVTDRSVKPGTYSLQLRQKDIILPVEISIAEVDYSFLNSSPSLGRIPLYLASFGVFFVKTGVKSFKSQTQLTQIYEGLTNGEVFIADPDVVFHQFLLYMNNIQFLNKEQKHIIECFCINGMIRKELLMNCEAIMNQFQRDIFIYFVKIIKAKCLVDGFEDVIRRVGDAMGEWARDLLILILL